MTLELRILIKVSFTSPKHPDTIVISSTENIKKKSKKRKRVCIQKVKMDIFNNPINLIINLESLKYKWLNN